MVCPWAAGYLADGLACGAAGVPGAVGPGRPRDRHTRAYGSEWSISKPGQAPPPPTGPAAWPSVPSGTLHTGGACVAVCGWVRRLEARPGPAAAHGPRSLAPQPSGPVGTLHTGGACVAVRGWARRLEARPCPPCPLAPSTPAALVSLCVAGCVASKPGQASPPPTGTAVHGFHSLAQQVLRCPPYWSCKPPSGGGEITVRGGVMPKVQTTSAKNAENGLLWAKWSAFWAHRYLS